MKNHYLKVIVGSVLLIIITGSFNYKNENSRNFTKYINSEIKEPLYIEPDIEEERISEVPEKEKEASGVYFATNINEAQIGISEDKPIDNPIDNVFHIKVEKGLTGKETVWLEYELKGIQDFTGISRSINDQLAVGGYLVKKTNEWIVQKELVNPDDLKFGDNIIRFTLPENVDYCYQIRNLGIRIEPYNEIQSTPERRLIVNQPSTEYYYGKLGYMQGHVIGDDSQKAKVFVNGEKIRYQKGTFESLVEKPMNSDENWSVRVQAIFPDGQELYVDVPFNKPLDWDYKNEFDKEIHYTEQLVTSSDSFSIQLASAKLEGDIGSLDKETKVSITALRDIDVPALDAGMINVTAGFKGYRFLPHGVQFQKDIAVELGYDTTKIPNGYGENDIKTYFFSEENHHWIAIPKDSTLLALNITKSRTNHFSDYINAIIKVPESPETQGYTPTSMKDVKAANPATGINLINPPTANSMGNANLSYPLNIPAGRQGMQPQLAISYNSGGGNGWLGLGWDLSVPSISVETRWGVPHYDPNDESETYLMSGEQLSPVAHRSTWEERDTDPEAEKQFYPRVEGSFSIIKRHGGSPSTYRWEVTDKSGVKYYYGGIGSVDNNAVLKDADGNIAHWALVEVRDLNDNFVKYNYTVQADKGVSDPNAIDGYQIYLTSITYTGHGSENGVYSVYFTRDRQLPEFETKKRKDVAINARYGFKQVSADLLKGIEIKFNTENIRSYELKYIDGAFDKKLLDAIIEKDSKDKIFTTHTFEYYDDVRDGNDYKPYEDTFEEWNTRNDDINGGFVSSKLGILDDNASAISGTKTKTVGAGLSANVGLGAKVWSKDKTVGGNYFYSKSESDGQLSLIDINGDGLPDKLIAEGSNLKFRPQIKSENGTTVEYGTTVQDIIFDDGSTDGFLKSTSKSHSIGLEVMFGVSIGANYGFGKSITSTYLTDANGDGLIDIVSDGVVFFNYVDDNGDVHFTENSGSTPNLISRGSLASGLVKVDSTELIKARIDNPLHDVVRMWKAPHDGTVKVDAPVYLVKDTSAARESYPADGVIVSIQHKENDPLWIKTIGANDYTINDPGIIDIAVNKGDNIYFRVQSIDDGAYDQVEWTPEIFYMDKDTSLTDANGKHVFKYKADEDYVLNAANGFMATPIDGIINMKSHLYIPATSDNIQVEVLHNDEVIKNIDIDWKEGYNDSINIENREVNKDDVFSFKVKTSSNIRWEEIVWKPYVYYTESHDTSVVSVYDRYGNPAITSTVVPEFSLLPNNIVITEQWVAQDSTELIIKPGIQFNEEASVWGKLGDDEYLTFTVKKKDSLLFKQSIPIFYNENLDSIIYELPDSINAIAYKDESVHLEYHTTNLDLAKSITTTKSQISYKEFINDTISCDNPDSLDINKIEQVIIEQDTICIYRDTIQHTDSVYAGLNSIILEDYQIFGHMYRNWGQFAYDGNGDRASQVIIESDLNITEARESAESMEDNDMNFDDVENDEDLGNSFEEQGAYNPEGDIFIMLVPYGNNNSFIGQDELTYITSNIISSSRKGQDQLVLFDPLASLGGGATAIDKISKNQSISFNASIGSGSLSVGGSYARTWDKLLTDYIDMNGDRYPDIVTDEKIQYTNHLGALSTGGKYELDYATEANDYSTSNSFGVSIGGSQLGSKKESTNNVKTSKYALTGNASLSGNYANNETHYTWRDINGDGLPDRINKDDGKVNLNLGYELAPAESWGSFDINKGQSISISAGGGISKEININNGSIKAGIGLGGSRNILKSGMQDVNGDGLLDIVEVDENIFSSMIEDGTGLPVADKPVKVRLNTGNGFSPAVKWKGANFTSKSKSVNESINVAFTVGFTIFGTVKVTVTPNITFSRGFSKENLTLNDVDGDGFPDYIESDVDKTLRVKKSKLGKVNKLKKVKRPLHGEFAMDYKPVGNTYKMPQSVWALSKVSVYDGYVGDGENELASSFEYADGYHDRHERAFYGFGEVKSHQLDKDGDIYRTTVQNFNNGSYYEKGLLLSQSIQDIDSNKYAETINSFDLKTFSDVNNNVLDDVLFPALVETNKYFYDIKSGTQLSTKTSFVYGDYGNVETYTDHGGDGASDDITAKITYHEVKDKNILSVPESITVSGAEGGLRFRSTSIDENIGKITQIRQKIDNSTWAEYDMFYNEYGNMDSIVRPENYKGERMYFTYTYDDVVHNYITNVNDAFGYSSSSTHDYKFGQVKSTTDINGQQTKYEIDDLGRITTITGPYELESGAPFTIQFEYHHDAEIPWARTRHYDPEHPDDFIQTAIFIDGLGRVLQTKKDAALFSGKDNEDEQIMIASGKVIYDAYGRAEKSYYPVIDRGAIGNIVPDADESVDPTIAEYDVLDRTILSILPDGAETVTFYTIDNDPGGNTAFITSVTDANGITTLGYTDIKGRQTAVKAPAVNGAPDGVITSFIYNAINELISVTDAEGNTTISEYDMLGRRLSRLHPDAGLTEFTYDPASNMLTQLTANLREENMEITYEYEHSRLTNITYPQNTFNNVRFEYGEPGAEHKRAGRIVVQEDATGAQEFFYGQLGEIVKNIRTIIIPDEDIYTFETKWEYDTWNRLKKMTYPDGEEVIYNYNTGGLLQSMYGKKKGHRYNYINQLGYDKFEDRAYIAYGNGTETFYEYEPDRRRLHHIATTTSAGRKIMDNTYTYDDVNNISKLKGIAPIPEEGFLGGNFEYNYNYDNLYRLESANGQWNGNDKKHRYSLNMKYSPTGSIKSKNQLHEEYNSLSYAWNEKHKTSYDWDYKYEDSKPHAPNQIGDNKYTYDANGNQTNWQSTVNNQRRDILWDEENRIRAIADNGQTHHYMYDALGERVIKATGDGQAIYINGFPMGGSGTVGSYTMYVSPYMVATSARFTKHYYIEGQRIVSKIGEPAEFQHIFPSDTVIPAGGDTIDWDLKGQALKEAIYANFETLGLGGAVFTAGRSGKIPYGQIKKYYRNSNLVNGNGSSTNQTDTVISNKYEKFQYFYHPDHLGSSSYITDASGEVQQHMEYFPFGETFVEEHHGHDRYSNFKFNGKELDEETGLYYYGARYYDPRISMWYGVDPKLDKAPSWTPYRAFFNNPLRYVDPDGQWEADSDGNLIAEKGDQATSLAKFQGIKYSEALKQLTDQGYTVNSKGILNLKIGDKVELNNVYTESIKNSTSNFDTDAFLDYKATGIVTGTGPTSEDNYNCWGSAIEGSQGNKIEVGVGIPAGSTFNANLSTDYIPTGASNAKFGKTVLRFANSSGVQHGAVFYGRSKNGAIYVYTKNGWAIKPEVMKLSDLKSKIPSYGNVQGINTGDSGYYEPK